jgi:hypothetical protein
MQTRTKRRSTLRRFLIPVLALVVAGGASAQEKRVALVVGNASYADQSAKLDTPLTDAVDVVAALAKAGFQVSLLTDAKRADLEKAIRDFGDTIKGPNTVGLFYYGGQAAQSDGHNYLLSIDSSVHSEDELKYNATDAELVLAKMKSAANKLDIAVFDANYLNPYPGSAGAATRGLAAFTLAVPESVVLFGAEPGKTAPQGSQHNSFLTKAFLANLPVPDQDIAVMVKHLLAQVRSDTGGRQVAWASSSVTQDFAFVSGTGTSAPSSPTVIQAATPAPATTVVNLVQNPDAKQQPVTKNGWSQVSGDWTTLKDGPNTAAANIFFWPGKSAKADLYQDVSLAAYSKWVGASGRMAHLDYSMDGYSGDKDAGKVTLEARDSSGKVLATVESALVHVDDWAPFSLDLKLPPSTTVIRIHLLASRAGGDNNDVYFKGLKLVLPDAIADKDMASGSATTAAAAPAAAPLPDLGTLDTTAFVKALPASRITAIATKSGYAALSGEIAKLDARMAPLLVDAYSYAGVKDEQLRLYLAPQSAGMNLIVYLRAPSGKTSAYFPSQGATDFTATLAENGTYLVLVGTPETWELGPYILWAFGRGTSVDGEITIFDDPDPDTFGNYMHKLTLDTNGSVVYVLTIESADIDTAVLLKDANGNKVNGTTVSDKNTTRFTFESPGGQLTAYVRADGSWPTGKFKLTLRATDLGGGS